MIAPEAIEDAASAAERFSDAIFMLGRGADDIGTFGVPPSLYTPLRLVHAWQFPVQNLESCRATRNYLPEVTLSH